MSGKFYVGVAAMLVVIGVMWWLDRNGYERAMAAQAEAVTKLETELSKMRVDSQEAVDAVELKVKRLRRANHELIKQALQKDESFKTWHDIRIPDLAADIFWMWDDAAGGALPGRPRAAQADPVAGPPG